MTKQVKDLLSLKTKESNTILSLKIPKSQKAANNIADLLVQKFHAEGYRPLFLKVAWRLDPSTIDRLVTTAFERGNNPQAYFITLVKREKAYYIEPKEKGQNAR